MVLKSKRFVNRTKLRSRRLTIQTQIPLSYETCSFHGPLQYRGGNSAPGKRTTDHKPVQKRGFILNNVWPKELVVELKLYGSDDLSVVFG
jgi:hypothetical protein